ncbi:hypothetical protein [Candidatus Chlorohelix sp.]|uniref:hypothetical protein n=1 Tax=Candidatus Chlorohelix sp. TaxID=3139201 RepID=UPI00304C6F82
MLSGKPYQTFYQKRKIANLLRKLAFSYYRYENYPEANEYLREHLSVLAQLSELGLAWKNFNPSKRRTLLNGWKEAYRETLKGETEERCEELSDKGENEAASNLAVENATK